MKKLLLGCSLLLLAGCGSGEVNENANKNGNVLPLYMDLNNNQSLPLNWNMNLAAAQTNTNASVIMNSNANQNGNANTNSVAVLPPVDTNLALPHETPFDCKAMSLYATMAFYEGFQKQFENLSRYSTGDIAAMVANAGSETDKQAAIQAGKTTKENLKNITSACFAKDESLFVAVVEGEAAGHGFKVVRYQPFRGVLEVAQREDDQRSAHWAITPGTFGKRAGTVLELAASGKSGDNTEWIDYSYNYVTNFLRVAEYCVRVPGQNKTCMAYPYP